MRTRRHRLLWFALVGAAVLAGCGDDPEDAGVEVIEGELTDQIGLGELDAQCDEPDEREEGEEFECSATTDDGDTIDFIAEFDSEDEIFVYPTNVVAESEMAAVEAEAAQTLGTELGVEIDPGDVVCPDETTVLDDDLALECTITDAASGDRYALTATFSDLVRDEGFQNRFYEIGDEPL